MADLPKTYIKYGFVANNITKFINDWNIIDETVTPMQYGVQNFERSQYLQEIMWLSLTKNDSYIHNNSLFNLPLRWGQPPGSLLTFPQ